MPLPPPCGHYCWLIEPPGGEPFVTSLLLPVEMTLAPPEIEKLVLLSYTSLFDSSDDCPTLN